MNPANPKLFTEFVRWWQQNQFGGLPCYWRRKPVWGGQLIQKLGKHSEVSARLFWGESMQVITGETVSRSILSFGYSEVAITALMLYLVKAEQAVVDIGTHFGYEALLACELVGTQGKVFCFEPSPTALPLARKNLGRFPQAELYQQAVADHNGTLKLQNRVIWKSAFNSATLDQYQGEYVEVPVTTLDYALANRIQPIDFLKCDVEGFEMAVLRGAHELPSNDAPVLVLETDMPSEDGRASKRAFELAEYLERYSYQALSFDFNGSLRLGVLDSFPVHHANIAFIPQTYSGLLTSKN